MARNPFPVAGAVDGKGTDVDQRRLAEGSVASDAVLAFQQKLEAILHQLRERGRFFDPDYFSDPAWDILLRLALAEVQLQRVSVGHLKRSSNVPGTTLLRWVRILKDRGYVVRHQDPFDKRRQYVELTPSASAAMRGYLESI